jgi:hypothetical protein
MLRAMLAVSVATLLPLVAAAQSTMRYQCTMGDLTRRVEVVQSTSAPVPCAVEYFKDSEAAGERQVLWSASNEAGYCEARAAEFVGRLGELGWTCGDAVAVEPEADDTDEPSPQQ